MIGTLEERFWDKVAIAADDEGCWEWTAGTNRAGYGQIRDGEYSRRAHRLSWELKFGPIPDGLNVLHRCDTPPCIRPGHLFLGTQTENMRDMYKKGRSWSQTITHCPKGHEHSEGRKKGRRCRECHRIASAERYRAANKEELNSKRRAHRAANRDRINAEQQAYRAAKAMRAAVE